jgi:hypothetical protein
MNCLKTLVFFFIFATGCCGDKHHHNTLTLFNKSICKSIKDNSNVFIPFKKRVVYYACKHSETRKRSNPYAVVATNILRKYIYIVNVVVIYIILYSL